MAGRLPFIEPSAGKVPVSGAPGPTSLGPLGGLVHCLLSGKVAVVSSSYHLFRAKLIASGLGVDVSGVAAFPGNPVVTVNYFIREAPAVWKQLLLNATSAS